MCILYRRILGHVFLGSRNARRADQLTNFPDKQDFGPQKLGSSKHLGGWDWPLKHAGVRSQDHAPNFNAGLHAALEHYVVCRRFAMMTGTLLHVAGT
jgi:hypothetical protein